MAHDNPHVRSEERSIVLHGAVAQRLREDPTVLLRARARVRSWRDDGSVHPEYVDAWERVLSGSTEEVARFLVHGSEHARDLRQVSPFAGVLDARARWSLLKGAREQQRSGER